LKFVAQFENGKERWFTIHPKRPSFYNLEGKDNIVFSLRIVMSINPLLIKGAGAAEVTASGILLMLLETFKTFNGYSKL
jgi:hypothetical protein